MISSRRGLNGSEKDTRTQSPGQMSVGDPSASIVIASPGVTLNEPTQGPEWGNRVGSLVKPSGAGVEIADALGADGGGEISLAQQSGGGWRGGRGIGGGGRRRKRPGRPHVYVAGRTPRETRAKNKKTLVKGEHSLLARSPSPSIRPAGCAS